MQCVIFLTTERGSMMASTRNPAPIRIGLVADEPIRLAGLSSIFEQPAAAGKPPLLPIPGTIEQLLTQSTLEYLVVDLSSAPCGLEILDTIRRARPNLRLIVIGPEGNDELVMESIIAGARGYLELTAGPEMVRRAIEAVTSGSIWAPRRLLSKLIDRLLKVSDTSLINSGPHLTGRERQVLEHILMARSNREIARHLGIEERTVKAHVGRLMRKTGADNRIELSMRALHQPQAPLGKAGQGSKEKPSRRLFINE
jgi:DNA-binding NarL/FixJ family response regulator